MNEAASTDPNPKLYVIVVANVRKKKEKNHRLDSSLPFIHSKDISRALKPSNRLPSRNDNPLISNERHAPVRVVVVRVQQLHAGHETLRWRWRRRLCRLALFFFPFSRFGQNEHVVLGAVFAVPPRWLFRSAFLQTSLVGRDVIRIVVALRILSVGALVMAGSRAVVFPDVTPSVVVGFLRSLLPHLLFVGGVVFDLAFSLNARL